MLFLIYIYIYILYTHIHADVNRNIMMTSMNERIHFFRKIYLSHFILKGLQKGCERVDVGYVWKVSWRRGQTATYWPKVLLATIIALLPHLGWAAQPWVIEGPSPLSGAGSYSAGILSPTATGTELTASNSLTPAVCGTWLYNCLPSSCFLWAYASVLNSTTSTSQGDIPTSPTGCTCLAVLLLIYTGASLDWRLGRGSICYIYIYVNKRTLLLLLHNTLKNSLSQSGTLVGRAVWDLV